MIIVNCQSSIRIETDKVFYFDPLKVEPKKDADYIFITHPHYDHLSKEDILNVKKETTKIFGPKEIVEYALSLGFLEKDIAVLEPNKEVKGDTFQIKTVPAYNKGKNFHPKSSLWLGYVLTSENTTYYIMGDTDALEENESISCDYLFIPIGGTYTMNAKEASEFTNKLNPKKVIPIHYGFAVGSRKDFLTFCNYVKKDIEILELLKICE